MADSTNTRRLVGYVMLGGAILMGILAAMFRTEVIADAGAPRNAISLVLGGIAALDAAIGAVLIVKS